MLSVTDSRCSGFDRAFTRDDLKASHVSNSACSIASSKFANEVQSPYLSGGFEVRVDQRRAGGSVVDTGGSRLTTGWVVVGLVEGGAIGIVIGGTLVGRMDC